MIASPYDLVVEFDCCSICHEEATGETSAQLNTVIVVVESIFLNQMLQVSIVINSIALYSTIAITNAEMVEFGCRDFQCWDSLLIWSGNPKSMITFSA